MDRQIGRHDEQFETFLRQFQLRKPDPLPGMTSGTRRPAMRWILAAAVVTLVVAGSILLIRSHQNSVSLMATVEAAGTPSLYKAGETIDAGRVIQANSAVGLVLALKDGSHVEMRSQSQLALESAADGIRIRLNDGSILVTAAKQGAGHLYVQTRDAVVSVVGTVFFVSTESTGTRVAVVEGEVHVQQGAESKKLLPGEQVGSNPAFTLIPVAEEIAWSRNAATYVAMLQPPVVAAPSQPQQQALAPVPVAPKPPQEPSAKDRFNRDCTACHSAGLADELIGRASQFSVSDRELLSKKQAEVLALLRKGDTEKHPDVVKLRSEIAELSKRADASTQNFNIFAFGHSLTVGRGGSKEDQDDLLAYLTALAQLRQVSNPLPNPDLAAPPSTNPEEPVKKEDPEAAGARILNNACTSCHDLGPITRRMEDKASWESIVTGMVGGGADVKDSEIPILVDYLFRHYGPPPKDAPAIPVAPTTPAPPAGR